MLGASVVVTNAARFCGQRYRDRLYSLGAWPDQVIEPREVSMSPLENLAGDASAIDLLAGAMKTRVLDLSTFYHDTGVLPHIIGQLCDRGLSPKVRPGVGLPAECVTRSGAMALLKRYGVPTLAGRSCKNNAEVSSAAEEFGRALIKLDREPPMEWKAEEMLKPQLSYPVYVERYIPVRSSPNMQWMSAGGLNGLMICDQIVRDLRHVGNRSTQAREIKSQIRFIQDRVGSICKDYAFEGPIGIDAIVDESGRLAVVDINPRFNSCTYPLAFLNAAGLRDSHFVYEHVEFRTAILDDIYFDERFLRYNNGAVGSLLVGPAAQSVGGPTRGAFLLSVAGQLDRADEIHQRNLDVLRAWQ